MKNEAIEVVRKASENARMEMSTVSGFEEDENG